MKSFSKSLIVYLLVIYIKHFRELNIRFNTILNDSRMRFRDNLSSLNPKQFHSYVQNILPQIIDRLISFTFGTYDTDEVSN